MVIMAAAIKFCSLNNAACFWACSESVALLWLWSTSVHTSVTARLAHNHYSVPIWCLNSGGPCPVTWVISSPCWRNDVKDRNILSCQGMMPPNDVSCHCERMVSGVLQGVHACCSVPFLLGHSVYNCTNSVIYTYRCADCAVEQFVFLAADGVHPRVLQKLR